MCAANRLKSVQNLIAGQYKDKLPYYINIDKEGLRLRYVFRDQRLSGLI